MQHLWNQVRPQLAYIAALSCFINLLFLIPAIHTLQVFDRVIFSNSRETLPVLLLGTGLGLLFLLLLDYVRNRSFHPALGLGAAAAAAFRLLLAWLNNRSTFTSCRTAMAAALTRGSATSAGRA